MDIDAQQDLDGDGRVQSSPVSSETGSPPSPSLVDEEPTATSSSPQNQNKYGSLHLLPASFEQFIELHVSDFGKYDYVEGVLIAHEMASRVHNRTLRYLTEVYNVFHRRSQRPLVIHMDALVAIKSYSYTVYREHSMTTRSRSRTRSSSFTVTTERKERRADLAIGEPQADEQASTQSLRSDRMDYPVGHPPKLVLDVTSNNRLTDLSEKKRDYAHAEVKHYIIIDRDVPHKHQSNFRPAVHVGVLRDGCYRWREYLPGRSFRTSYFGTLYVDDLLDPPDPREIVRNDVVEEDARVQGAEQRAAQAEARAERKSRKYEKAKRALEAAGIYVSESSSSSSPPRRPGRCSNRA